MQQSLHNSKDVNIYDNIIITNSSVDAAVQGVHDPGVDNSIPLTGLNMYNNQIIATSSVYCFQYFDYQNNYSNFGTIHNNFYTKPSATNAFALGSSYTFSNWQAAGYDAGSLNIIAPTDSVRNEYNATGS